MSENVESECIIIGIGNSGRQDDGLGWAFLDSIINKASVGTRFEYKYQLQIEDAELIGEFKTVIFVDASKNDLENSFSFEKCGASNKYSFSTHSLVPETILYLSEHLYDHKPKAYVFAIQGYEWELKNGLSKKGTENLNNAVEYFTNNIPF